MKLPLQTIDIFLTSTICIWKSAENRILIPSRRPLQKSSDEIPLGKSTRSTPHQRIQMKIYNFGNGKLASFFVELILRRFFVFFSKHRNRIYVYIEGQKKKSIERKPRRRYYDYNIRISSEKSANTPVSG